jgi:hypothetical protein
MENRLSRIGKFFASMISDTFRQNNEPNSQQVTINNRMISLFNVFCNLQDHSSISISSRTWQGLSNEPKYVMIGRLEPEF